MKTQILPSKNLPPSNDSQPDEQLDLGRVVSALKRGSFIIVVFTAAAAAVAGVRAQLSPPSYSSSFQILIQPSSKETEVISSIAGVPLNRTGDVLSLDDQAKILTGPSILAPVVERIQAEGLSICADLGSPDVVAQSTEDELKQKCYKRVRSSLAIQLTETDSRNTESRIFTTRYSGPDPEEVQLITDWISNRFLDYGLESRQRDIQQGLYFLDNKLPDVQQRVDRLQSDLQDLRESNNFITPEARGDQLANQINSYESQYRNILVDIQSTQTLYQDLQQQLAQLPQDASASPVLSKSERYTTLLEELLRLDSKIAEASTLYLDNSPDMEALMEQRQNLLQLLAREGNNVQRELGSQLNELSSRESALTATLNQLDSEVDELASLSRQYTDLERDLNIATDSLTKLLDRREALQIEAAQRELPWELVTPPSIIESSASLIKSMALGGILGLLLSVGVVLLLDLQRDIVYKPADLKRITPVSILGLIPYNALVARSDEEGRLVTLHQAAGKSRADWLVFNEQSQINTKQGLPAFIEAFRSLGANLQRAQSDNPIKSLVICAAENSGMNSTTSAYLAWAAAEMGNRVLLIDANLRQPKIHNYLALSNDTGLANMLLEKKDFKSALQQSPLEPNLYIIPAGLASIDPVRIFALSNFKDVMAQAKADFDLVIIEAPPFSDYADSALIAAEADGLALVANLGRLKSVELVQTLEKLWISKIPLVGLIARETPPKSKMRLF